MITRGDNEKGDLRMTKCSEEVERQSAHDGKRATSCKTIEWPHDGETTTRSACKEQSGPLDETFWAT